MIAPWLLYATFIGALLGLVALLGERVLRWRAQPARWIWLAVICLTVVTPVLLNLVPQFPVPVPLAVPIEATLRSDTFSGVPERSATLDRSLLILWLLASTLLAARVIGTAVALRRRRRTWIRAELGGLPVLLSDDLGPALVGWRRFTTVLPRWALTFDERSRALMLDHEAEHARSGDPYLRSIALVALILMPWNLALWWAMRRLRLAVEIDCDLRLLDRGVDRHDYASVLLAVAEHISATPFAWATALGGSRSFIEQRIVAMTSTLRPRHPRIATAAINAGVFLIAMVACATPVPESVVPPPTVADEHAANSVKIVAGTPAANLIRIDTVQISCSGPGCRPMNVPPTLVLQSKPLPIGRMKELSGLDTLRIDTLVTVCRAGSACRGGNIPDTMIRLRFREGPWRRRVVGGVITMVREPELYSYVFDFGLRRGEFWIRR